MPTREATYWDLVPMAKILADAFRTSQLLGKYMHPYADQYPNDMYLGRLRMLRSTYFDHPDHRLVLSYEADDAGNEKRITGAAVWERKRAHPPAKSLYDKALHTGVDCYNYLESLVYPNRAADPTRADVLERAAPFTNHHWTGTRAESWYLSVIGVDPFAERKGYGKEMVLYGFELARKDGVGCSVIAAPGRGQWYTKLGFDVYVGTTGDVVSDEDPLRGIEVATIHFWDNGIEPRGIKRYGEQ